jgi:hypothetical protein
VRERVAEGKSFTVDKAALKELFLALGYDKVTTPEEEGGDEEEGGEERSRPPPKEEVTDYAGTAICHLTFSQSHTALLFSPSFAERAFDLIDSGKDSQLDLRHILTTINTCKLGYGEPAFRFALKAFADDDSAPDMTEDQLWKALTRTSSQPLDAVTRNHLRRAWRDAIKAARGDDEDDAAEAGDEAGGGEDESKAAEPRVQVEEFVGKVGEDELLATIFLREVPIPIAEPAEGDEPPVDDS